MALTLGNVASFAGSYLAGKIASKLQTKNTAGLFCLLLASGLVLCRMFAFQTGIFIAFYTIVNFAIAGLQCLVIALYSDVAVYVEYHYQRKAHSFVVGLSNLPIGISTISNSIILFSAVLKSSGYIAGATPTMAVKLGLSNIFLYLICATCIGRRFGNILYLRTQRQQNG